MRILHISDSHQKHQMFPMDRFKDVDMVIHSGDCSNHRDPYQNEWEVKDFIEWYKHVPVANKIYVAGNHDTSIEKKLVTKVDFAMSGIIYLEHEFVDVEGLRIFGSPYTPTFGNWSFMKKRETIHRTWDVIPTDNPIDIFICHGPPKGILDYSINRNNQIEQCGDSALRKVIINKIKPKLFLSGHIHDCEGISNAGIRVIQGIDTIFSNGTCVMDGRFDKGIVNTGNIFKYDGCNFTF